MEKEILNGRLEELKNKLREENKIVKEIDFFRDIDVERSDKYHTDSKKGCIKFLCGNPYHLKYNDYIVLDGKLQTEGDSIKLISQINKFYQDKIERGQILIDKQLDNNRYSIMNCIIDTSNNNLCQLIFANNEYYSLLLDIKDNKLLSKLEVINDARYEKTIFYSCILGNKTVTVSKNIGGKYQDKTNVHIPSKAQKHNITYDIIHRKLTINNVQVIFEDFNFNPQGISLANIKDSVTNIKEITYGERKGYIYLKPIEGLPNKVRLFMLYSGNGNMEYWERKSNKWIKVSNQSTISNFDKLYIRISMENEEKIYSIIIAEDE